MKQKSIAKKVVKKNLFKDKEERTEAIAKCLATSLLLSKEKFENLTPDEFKKLFGNWKQKELKILYKIYHIDEEGLK